MQKIIASRYSRLDSGFHIAGQRIKPCLDDFKRAEFLLERHHLPIVILGRQPDLILRKAIACATHLLRHLRQLVAIDNLPAGKERQSRRDTTDDTVLHHRHRHIRSHIQFHQPLVGDKATTRGAHAREITSESVFSIVLRHSDLILRVPHPHVIGECLFEALIQRKRTLGRSCRQRQNTYRQYKEESVSYPYHCYLTKFILLYYLRYSLSIAAIWALFLVDPRKINQ